MSINNFLFQPKLRHTVSKTRFQAWPSDGRVAMLRLMAYGAGEDDIVLILHMDRKDHLLMNYAQKFDRLPTKEQEALTLLVKYKQILLQYCHLLGRKKFAAFLLGNLNIPEFNKSCKLMEFLEFLYFQGRRYVNGVKERSTKKF